MKSIHQSKKVKTNLGFGRWEDHGKNNKETMKSCSFCDYVSKHASNLNKHMKVIHFKQKSTKLEKCDKCDYTSDRQGNVKRHMEEVKHVREHSQRTKSTTL